MRNLVFSIIGLTIWVVMFGTVLAGVVVLGAGDSARAQMQKGGGLRQNPPPAEQLSTLRDYGMDWDLPVVSVRFPVRAVQFLNTQLSIIANEPVRLINIPEGWELKSIQPSMLNDQRHYYLLITSELEDGEYNLDLQFVDAVGNITVAPIKLTASANRLPAPGWENPAYFMPATSLFAIANKQVRLPEDFEPQDLVLLTELGVNVARPDTKLREEAAKQLQQMVREINRWGISYTVTSAYRSFADQVQAYNFWLDYNDGDSISTDTVSARPGHSEHQLGTTVDFITSQNGGIFYGFENTALSAWLAANAWKYGFVMSYPAGSQPITGYVYEPWHYRYIGVESAAEFVQTGLTLTEWLEQKNLVLN